MTELTQWILWILSIVVTIITFIIPLIKAKKDNRFLRSSLNVLKESNRTLSEKVSELTTKSEMENFYIKLKNDINLALESEKEFNDLDSKPKKKKSLAEAFGVDSLQDSTEREIWEYFTDWRVKRRIEL
ncbi:hypothetical protein D1013_09020 [Euzebyella marina]|uniref:Uncharacterized protein n=1 Tax=Euzebyella marina TaxID=1761453 RepID=A0A3G2L5H7_9FLAO|nr:MULTISPECIES: hypothetical protein [Bacteroidota]AYN67493.1 hypothetical protein D1013_09020 [Euzebyella marina]MBC7000885.1 hypothetical protein [Cytophaga sp. FL35]